jgi:CHAT domain-containing protein
VRSLLLRVAAQWIPFDRLAAMSWRSQLIVFSSCSTGAGGPRDGRGLCGVAQAATQAGATSVVASLWPVDDDAANRLMVRYHTILRQRRDNGDALADLREILRSARDEARGEQSPDPARPTSRDGYRSGSLRDAYPEGAVGSQPRPVLAVVCVRRAG